MQTFTRKVSVFWAIALCFCLSQFSVFAQPLVCPDGEVEVRVEIVPDSWAATETDWEVKDITGATVISGSTTGGSFCITPAQACFTFNIYDTYGDGLIQDGSYSVYFNDTLITSGGNFGYFATVDFGVCPAGYSCHFPISVFAPNTYTATPPNTWYTFTPDTSGRFIISTCATAATCNTGIWMYDYCNNLPWATNMEASIYYSTQGCEPHASLLANLQKNHLYYLRIGDVEGSCAGNDITWDIVFDGPITGCTDPFSCNFDPVATLNDPAACLYPGDPACPNGPDLIVVQSALASSLTYATLNNTDGCYIEEGCLTGYGVRDILRFTTHIKNIGNQDYYIGTPPASTSGSNEQWEWDPCHGHWHYEGYAEYLVYDTAGTQIPVGFKNGFCVMDLECSDGGVAKFNCGNQGITAGCGDIYGSSLACQWIDITNLPQGTYTLVVRVNWDQSPDALGRIELDHYNNWAQVCINIQRDAEGNLLSVTQDTACEPYTDCLNEIYGSAQPDCEGVCNGQKIIGDLDPDGIYHANDLLAYLTGILNNEFDNATSCNDLNADGVINIADAGDLLSCILQTNGSHTHPGGGTAHNHCVFPAIPIINPNGVVSLTLQNINPEQNYVDIYIKSPFHYVVAYQLQITGLQVAGVFPILDDPNYNADLFFNPEGAVLGISLTESAIDRYLDFSPFLRVYYTGFTAPDVCLTAQVLLNNNYEQTIFEVVNPCLPAYLFTGIPTAGANHTTPVRVSPNPFSKIANFTIFPQPDNAAFNLQIFNTGGQVVKTLPQLAAGNHPIDLADLPAGVYFYKLTGKQAVYTGKLIAE
ncbi:MAG TPA: lysyl oxidase family protein [Chitinophagales bacterium]|nr:lysyl oxidase family protein [Chitinophagales bacterium]HRK28345.1 lysyl oxidase family protein [Chitinophagales bacterium]